MDAVLNRALQAAVKREEGDRIVRERTEAAIVLVALRGGEPPYIPAPQDGDQHVEHARLLVREVVALLSGKPIEAFNFQTERRPWRVTIKDRAPKMAGKIEATALGRGLLRVLPNICLSTYLYVEGSAAKR